MTEVEILDCIRTQTNFPLTVVNDKEFANKLEQLIMLLNEMLRKQKITHKIYTYIPANTILQIADFSICGQLAGV